MTEFKIQVLHSAYFSSVTISAVSIFFDQILYIWTVTGQSQESVSSFIVLPDHRAYICTEVIDIY